MGDIKVLCIGDIHAKCSNIKEIRDLTAKLKQIVLDTTPDFVVVLGDLHDTFEKIHVQALNIIDYFINEMIATDVDIYYTVGNHCMINNSCFLEEDHAFNVFKGRVGLQIVDKPLTLIKDGIRFTLLPYTPIGRFEEALDTLEGWKESSAIFAHQEFFNAKIGHIVSENGDKWPSEYPLVISGHIHDRTKPQSNINYVGTPHCVSFGEDPDKTVSLFTFNDKGHTEGLIRTNMPAKVTAMMSASEFAEYQVPDNCLLRIIVSGSSEEISSLKNSKKYKELSQIAKVITKITDRVVVKKNVGNLTYSSLLSKFIEDESDLVKKVYSEVVNENR